MTDQDKQDHWGNLAENVGATPPPDSSPDDQPGEEKVANENENVPPEDADQSPIGWGMTDSEANDDVDETEQTPPDDIETIEIESRKVHSYRPKSGWDDLANDFDLPQAEEPPEVAEEPPELQEEAIDAILVEPEATAAVVENQDVVDEPYAAMPSEDVSAVDEVADEIEEEQSSEESPWFGADDFDALFDDSPSDSDEDTAEESKGPSFDEAVESADKEIDEEKSTGKRRKRRRRRPRKTEGKGDSSQENATPEETLDTEVISIEDTSGFGAGLFGDTKGPDDASNVFSIEEEVADASEVLEISPTVPDETESSQDESKASGKKRGRRRRRRGSGKKKESAAETTEGDEPTSQGSSDEEVSEKSSRRGSRKKRSDADRKDSDGGRRVREPKSEDDEDEKRAVSHRGIPSWDEAIESIIATNMEKHSKKSSGGSSSRSRGGRGRGGKEKSGSRKRSN